MAGSAGQRRPGIELHLIGPLQSNKAREAVALFDAIHTIDRDRIAEALAGGDAAAGPAPPPPRSGQHRRRSRRRRASCRRKPTHSSTAAAKCMASRSTG